LLAEEEEGDDWRGAGDGELRPPDVLLDSLRDLAKEKYQRERQREGKEIEERRRARVHHRRQNRPEMLAGLRTFGKKFHRIEGAFAREKKRGRGRRSGAICSRGRLGGEDRVARGGGIGRPEGIWLERVSCPGKKRKLTYGPGSSARGRSEGAYRFGSGADWAMGRIWSWAGLVPPASFFFSLFSFSLFYFLIFDLFQSFCNLFQINSNKFLDSSNIHCNVLNQ
jgi:hypothetical protein